MRPATTRDRQLRMPVTLRRPTHARRKPRELSPGGPGRHSDQMPPPPQDPAGRPTLVVVSGPAGSGKTTLAHRLAAAVPCPALCRDEIKEGMVASLPGFVPAPSDALTLRTYDLFFATIRLFLQHGVTHVAEAAFQHPAWVRGLEPLLPLADLRIIRCHVDPDVARQRALRRAREQPGRAAHDDATHFAVTQPFVPLSLAVPTFDLDTSEGFVTDLGPLLALVRSGGPAAQG